jgi:hypothetical protein
MFGRCSVLTPTALGSDLLGLPAEAKAQAVIPEDLEHVGVGEHVGA